MPGTDDDDDEATRPPPHPMDRTWIHPSELFAAQRSPENAVPPPPVTHRRGWRRDALLALTAGTVGAMATISVLGIVGAFDREPPRTAAGAVNETSPTDAAQIASQVAPGIAAVITTTAGVERRGSGVAVSDHQVMTTSAVVDANSPVGAEVEVCISNRARHRATVVGRDPVTGLVLLSIPTLRFDPARMSGSDRLRAGDWIVAVGRTDTSGPWVSSGVVTATGGWTDDPAGTRHAGLINTNAELVDNARGGALVDRAGNVVGILAGAGSGPTRTAAVPSAIVVDVAQQLERQGWVSHGALGVRADDTSGGVEVAEVAAGSSAAEAGLRVGDRITAIDGIRTPDTAALVVEVRRRSAGQRVTVTVVRDGHARHLPAVLDRAESVGPDAGSGPFTPPATTQLVVATP
ncbi:MAG: trypsin-like peptidase domain-containing protein [Acidimicrobiia bacterium]|nr:trypsin-like peptidase domain-containing protein [Acidimicrobiia bacterium]